MVRPHLVLFLLFLLPAGIEAQSFFKRLMDRIDSTSRVRIREDRPMLTPFLAPTFAPETSLMFSLGGLYSFSLRRQDPKTIRSLIPFSAGYSINNSLFVTIRNQVFGPEDRWRLDGDIWLRDMPDNFFGVGYDDARNTERSPTTTLYDRFYWQVLQRFRFGIGESWFLGPAIHLNETNASNLNANMAEHPVIVEQGLEHLNIGLGLSASLDTRDFPVNPYRGLLVEFTLLQYLDELGSDNEYTALDLDVRGYQAIGEQEGRTLAWQVRTRMVVGEPPWPEYSQLGSPFDLRGYYWGRFRDELMTFALVEYRHMFRRRRPRPNGSYRSKHGFVAWLATGSIAPDWASLSNWLPNGGVGYRFEVQPRSNVRVDLGFGLDEVSFYLNFAEAF